MFTLEQKLDLVMRYIASDDETTKTQLKKAIIEALEEDECAVTIDRDYEIDIIIDEVLKGCGVPYNLLGYRYLTETFKLGVADPGYIRYNSITTRLYPELAAKFNSTPSRVERSIRHAIENAFDNGGGADYIRKVFGNSVSIHRGKLTNGEFISGCMNEITFQMKARGIYNK